jgi:type I restriction enzyme S subunit
MSSEWTDFKLGDLISVKHGYAFKSEFFSEVPTQYQLVTPGNFAIGGGFQLGKGKYYSGVIPEDYVLHKGDVVVTMTDLSRAADTLGYAAVIPKTEGTVWLHNQRVGLVEIKPGAAVQSNYLHYLLRSRDYRHHVVSGATGSTVKHTAPTRICEFRFLLPPLIEQESISTILGALDDRIALLRETNVTLEAIAQATFKSWFVDFDPVHAKQQGRAPEGMSETTAALFPDSFEESELGLVPRGWKIGTLANLATLNPESWTTKNHPDVLAYIDLANVKDNEVAEVSEYLFDEAPSRARRVLRDGDTIVGTVRPGNRSFAFIHEPTENLTGSTGFAVLRPTLVANTEFVYLAATQDASIEHLAHLADGAAYPAVRPDVVAGIQCVLPCTAIMQIFHDVSAPLLSKLSDNKQQAQTLATLRDTLLPRLISGQIRISAEGELV